MFVVTHGTAEGDVLKLQVTYVARGANGTDVRRRVERALDKPGLSVAGEFKVWKV